MSSFFGHSFPAPAGPARSGDATDLNSVQSGAGRAHTDALRASKRLSAATAGRSHNDAPLRQTTLPPIAGSGLGWHAANAGNRWVHWPAGPNLPRSGRQLLAQASASADRTARLSGLHLMSPVGGYASGLGRRLPRAFDSTV
jgi:hypothetical protein